MNTMFYFRYDETGNTAIKMWAISPSFEIGFINYSIKNGNLHIKEIEINSMTYRHFDSSFHFGTIIFNELLFHLKLLEKNFSTITGLLSWTDAKNNWITSIPFYADFPNFLNSDLGYTLSFHLYHNEDFTDEIVLPQDKIERKLELLALIKTHSKNSSDIYFRYVLSESTSE